MTSTAHTGRTTEPVGRAAGFADSYLRRIRPIASVVGGLALLAIGLAIDDHGTVIAAVIAFLSATFVSPAYVVLIRRIGGAATMRISVYVDAVLIALVVSYLPDGATYAIAHMWAIVLASLLCTPRDTVLVTVMSVVVVVLLAPGRGVEDVPVVLNVVILGVIGLTMAAVHRGEFAMAGARASLERQLRDAQRLAKVGSWEWDPATDVATWSDEMYRILGMDGPGPLGQRDFLQLVPDDEREWVLAQMGRSVSESEPLAFDFTIRRVDDGELRAVHGMAEQAEVDGQLRILGSLQDVTEHRRLEAMRDEFVAAASHELRTPTSIVAGFASTLAGDWQRFDDDERRRYVHEIDQAARRLSLLIEDVLQVSQIESGKLRCEHEPFDVVREASELASSWPGPLPIELDVEAGATATAVGDALRTRQVLTNLLANAERHTPAGTRAVIRVTSDEDRVHVSVGDDGPGIAVDDQSRIFDRFVRLDQNVVGTGLGLYLSRRLAEAQAGTLEVESEPGHGATFTLSLPAAAGMVER